MAMSMQDLKIAEALLDRMTALDPKESFVQQQRILVLATLGKSEESLRLAAQFYEQTEHSVESAMLFAQALQVAPPSETTELQFRELVARHPTHAPLCILYGNFLARRGQLPLAMTTLTAVAQKLPPAERASMLPVLIGLPLEVGDAKLAEAQLLQHRAALNQPELALFYEGRIRILQKNYKEAARLLGIVAKQLKDARQPQPQFLDETLLWLSKATFEANVAARLDQAIDAATNAGNPDAKPAASPSTDGKAPSTSGPAPEAPAIRAAPASETKPVSASKPTTE